MDDRATRQRELARLYLEKARQDLALVETVGDSAEIADEIIGFHIQQTIEKALKAVLTSLGREYSYTHDLSVLYLQVEDAGLIPPATIDSVEELTTFAVQFRYTLLTTPSLDRDAKTRLATDLLAWADAIIEQSPPPNNLHDNS